MTWIARVFRGLAIVIAVLGALDPEVTLTRADRPVVAVVNAGGDLAERLSRTLAGAFDVHAGAVGGAAATIVAGDAPPDRPLAVSGALFAVTPAPASSHLDLVALTAPATAPAASRIPVGVGLRAIGMRGRSIVVDLFAGALAVDSQTRVVGSDDEPVDVTLAMPPAAPGPLTARIVAHEASRSGVSVTAHAAIDVRDGRWRVLVVDPRPSWTSTFVRRALESDRRFDVASRVGTSKAVAAASGAAPALTDERAIADFDAIVIGAPDGLGGAEVGALERYARERGGAVVLLADSLERGSLSALMGGVTLADVHGVERRRISSGSGMLVATELGVPETTSGVVFAKNDTRRRFQITPLASAAVPGGDAPVIWQAPLGAGRVIVNGALDAWRYRTREHGGFATFWIDAIGAAAAASPAPLTLTSDTLRVAPGQTFDVRAVVRDAELSDPLKPSPAVDVDAPAAFWPSSERGVFHARVRAPDTPGNYELRVEGTVGAASRIAATLRYFVVGDADHRPAPAALAAWATAHGGEVLNEDAAGVVSRVRAAVSARADRARAHPMRSPWWLPVFVTLVGGEWWIRRRRGAR